MWRVGRMTRIPSVRYAPIVSPASATPVPCNPNAVGDSLFLEDQAASTSGVYSLTATTIAFAGAPPLLGYGSIQSLTLSGANGGDTMNVTTTPANANVTLNGGTGTNTYTIQTTGTSTNLTINGNSGVDNIVIDNTGANPFVVANGGAGANVFTLLANGSGGGVSFLGGIDNDTFNIGNGTLANLNSLLNINGGGHDATLVPAQSIANAAGTVPNNQNVGGDTLNLDDGSNASAGPFLYTLTATTFTFANGAAAQLGYSNIESLTLNGATSATSGDSISVVSTPDNANIVLNGGTGTIGDQIEISNTGKNDNLTINGNAGNDIITIDSTGASPFLIVNGGAGLNTFNLDADGASGAVSLRGGPDNDTFNVGNGSLNSLNGLLDIEGGGQDSGTVGSKSFTNAAGTATNNVNLIGDTLNLNDGGTASATMYTVTAQTITASSFGVASGSPQLGYVGIESLTLNAAAGNDTVNVSNTPDAANVTLNGGAGQNTFTVATTGSANNLTINGNGNNDTFTIQATGSNPYIVVQATAGANTFNLRADGAGTGGVQLLGGADNDQFNLGNGTVAGLLSLMDVEGGAHDANPVSSLAPIVSPASATPVPCNPNAVGDSLFLEDQAASTSGVYSLTATTIAFAGASPLLGYGSIQSLTLSGANGGDTMNVTTTPDNANVTLNGGTGTNTYTIQTTGTSTNLTINGNSGVDTVTIQNTGAKPFVIVNGGAGDNVFNLQADAAGGGVSLTGGADNDIFNLGTGTLAGLNSSLFVNGGTHDGTLVNTQAIHNDAGTVNNNAIAIGDTLNLLDQTNASAGVYALTANTFTFAGSAPQLGYSNIQSLVLKGSTGGNTINVATTPDNANITLDGGSGADTITITNTGANNNLTINGGAGNDVYTVDNAGALPFVIANGGSGINTFNLFANGTGGGVSMVGGPHNDTFNLGTGTLAGLNSLLDINGMGNDAALVATQTISNAAGSVKNNALAVGDTVNFKDQTDGLSGAYTLNQTTFQFADGNGSSPQALGFTNIETINLNAANGGDNIRVTKTPNSANINLNGGTGSNTFNVTSTGDNSNLFMKSNSASGNNDTFTIAGTGHSPFLVANGGNGLNTFNLQASARRRHQHGGRAKNDTYNLGSLSGNLGGINSLIDINGGAGHDAGMAPQKAIFSSLGTYPTNPIATGDALNLADQGNAQNAAYTLTANTFQFSGASPQIGYENIQSLSLASGSASNTLTAQSMPDSATVNLSTGPGFNAVKIVTTGANDNVFINSATSSGATDIMNTGQSTISTSTVASVWTRSSSVRRVQVRRWPFPAHMSLLAICPMSPITRGPRSKASMEWFPSLGKAPIKISRR